MRFVVNALAFHVGHGEALASGQRDEHCPQIALATDHNVNQRNSQLHLKSGRVQPDGYCSPDGLLPEPLARGRAPLVGAWTAIGYRSALRAPRQGGNPSGEAPNGLRPGAGRVTYEQASRCLLRTENRPVASRKVIWRTGPNFAMLSSGSPQFMPVKIWQKSRPSRPFPTIMPLFTSHHRTGKRR